MITTAPLPGWTDLLASLSSNRVDSQALARPWCRPGDVGLWQSRTAWSLAALADAVALLRGKRPLVALPDYICAGSLGPLHARADVKFYPVDLRKAAPLWAECDRLAEPDIFVLVHTFGYPNDIAEAGRFCQARGAMLVEDAAHVLRPVSGIGEFGSVTLYSPHKLLPVPDGAVMVVRSGCEELLEPLARASVLLGGQSPPSHRWQLRRAVQKTPAGRALMRLRPGGQLNFHSDPVAGELPRTPALSPVAGQLISRADLDCAAQARIVNAKALASAIADRADWQPAFPVEPNIAPYRLVMRAGSAAVASTLYDRLRQAGLPVESWPDLPGEIPLASTARHLRQTVLLLPCHQGSRTDALVAAYVGALR